jgi:hypothetical protein
VDRGRLRTIKKRGDSAVMQIDILIDIPDEFAKLIADQEGSK